MIDRRPIFADRREAGRRLAEALRRFADLDPVILALPRGGVPVGFEVAAALDAPLDLLFVRKIGAPGHPELGVGALVDGADPQLVTNPAVLRRVRPPPGYLEQAASRELEEIERRRALYLRGRAPLSVKGRTVLLVDDGVATGGTARAGLQGLKKADVHRVVLGLPLAPPDVVRALRREAHDVVCLATPEPFVAVGLWYHDFAQTRDAEVIELLAEADRRWAGRSADAPPERRSGAERAD